VCQARAGHDLLDGDTLKTVAIEAFAGAIDDGFLYGYAVTGGVGQGGSLSLKCRSMLRRGLHFPRKDYLEHILARWFYAGGSRGKFWRKNDER
jgi:hypothetical protein